MTTLSKLKTLAYKQINNLLDEKISNLIIEIESIKKSRNSDTKSSAGDKFETGREMMNIELGKNEALLSKTNILKNSLSKINLNETHKTVNFGSLVKTDNQLFFISIGIGKMEIDKNEYYAISITSPIGEALKGKKTGEKIIFQEREIIIKEIY